MKRPRPIRVERQRRPDGQHPQIRAVFRDGHRSPVTQVEELYVIQGRWWTQEEETRHVYRLRLAGNEVLTIQHRFRKGKGRPWKPDGWSILTVHD